ncbi:hypothetical protein [Roseivirga sp.]|uniref:hypothetical protein n=1 Tax=Roseivirga sp. TaxID=1964215 RepID=UPI003B8DAE89
MTKTIFIYILSTLLIFIILGVQYAETYTEYLDVFFLNIFYLLAFSATILILLKYSNIRLRSILTICFFFNLFLGTAYVVSINNHTDLFFQYVPSDAPFYDEAGRQVAEGNLIEGIQTLIKETKYGLDDMGMVFYVGMVYKVIDSPLLLKLVNLIINLLTTYLIFKLARPFMSKRFALLAALVFSISSFNLWFLIVGLKEPVVILLLVSYFHFLIKYMNTRKPGYFILMVLTGGSLATFRIALVLFTLVATAIAFVFRKGVDLRKALAIITLLGILGSSLYIYRDPVSSLINRENASVYKGDTETSSKINFPIVFAAGVFGPFPTIIPKTDKLQADVSVYAPSLILKVVISIYFLYGLVFMFKEKHYSMIALAAFCCIEILALTMIDSTFKLRYSFPHFPLFYIIAFYGMYYVFEKKWNESRLLREAAIGFQIASLGIVLLWNVLRL